MATANGRADPFETGYEMILNDILDQQKRSLSIDALLQKHLARMVHADFQAVYQRFDYVHVRRLVDILTSNANIEKVAFPLDLLNENGAAYLGKALNGMPSALELDLSERFQTQEPMAHHVLGQLNPEASKLTSIRVGGRLQATREIETFVIQSTTLKLLETTLCQISATEHSSLARLSDAMRQSESLEDLVFQSPTWQRLAVVLARTQGNPRIKRLDMFFDMRVGDESTERNDAMLECMRLLGGNASLHTLYISESAFEGFTRHSFYQVALANALRSNTTLRVLHMEGAINEEGMAALGEALQQNTTLDSITFPSIRRGSVIPFAQGLGGMKGLKMVMFWGSQLLSHKEAKAIADGLSQNKSIWHFQFSYNKSDPQVTKRIVYYLQLNELETTKLLANAPQGLLPQIFAVADRKSLSTMYTFIKERADLYA